jgi:hypothetical protein
VLLQLGALISFLLARCSLEIHLCCDKLTNEVRCEMAVCFPPMKRLQSKA